MKKLFLLVVMVMLGTVSSVNAQDISKDIVGKWNLSIIEIGGDKADAEEVFKMKLSQEYMADGNFIGTAGDKTKKGTFTISDDKKEIKVAVPKETLSIFKVLTFEADRMKLQWTVQGDTVILYYEKD